MEVKARIFKRESATAPTIKGFASVTIDDSVVISEIKIVNGKNGLFVSFPNRRLPSGEYKDIAFPITKEARKQIVDEILAEYNKQGESKANEFEITDETDLPF